MTLRAAVDALVDIAEQAGIPAAEAREEAMTFAAAIAEAAPRAAAEWAAAQADSGDSAGGDVQRIHTAFFDAASRGRRYRVGATTLLRHLLDTANSHATAYATALTEVASAAASLGRADHAGDRDSRRRRLRRNCRPPLRPALPPTPAPCRGGPRQPVCRRCGRRRRSRRCRVTAAGPMARRPMGLARRQRRPRSRPLGRVRRLPPPRCPPSRPSRSTSCWPSSTR